MCNNQGIIHSKIQRNREREDRRGGEALQDREAFAISSALGGSYRILRELGRGGEGRVYLVRHLPTEQLRAAKQLSVKKEEDRLHELNMMKRLHHPSLPTVFDVVEDGDSVWLILEYIRGTGLHEIPAGELGAEQFFSVFRQLTGVLLYLHTREIPVLHLDIKPSNLLLKRDGTLMLIDFGAAVGLHKREQSGGPGVSDSGRGGRARPGVVSCSRFEVAGQRYGTPGFAAPEQYEKDGRLDVRTDIYGVGAMMYFCLYGRIPGKEGKAAGIEKGKRENAVKNCRELFRRKAGAQTAWDHRAEQKWKREAALVAAKCLEPARENRYPDCRTLNRAVVRLEKRYHRRKNYVRLGGTLLMLIFLLAFSIRALNQEYQSERQVRSAGFERLLDQAESLGFAQASQCYEQAVGMEPENVTVLLHFIERVMQDFRFSTEEEEELKKLLFTVYPGQELTAEERMASRDGQYGELAYRIGLCYWYYYEETGGRAAAARWFEKAVESQEQEEQPPDWWESAQIHGKIARYYDRLGREEEESRRREAYWELWRDTKALWGTESLRREETGIREQLAEEILACLIMQSGELYRRGEKEEVLQDMITELLEFTDRAELGEKEKDKICRQCQKAKLAVERAFSQDTTAVNGVTE